MFCPNCGKEVFENAKFCRYCGSNVEGEEKTDFSKSVAVNKQNDLQINTVFNRDVMNNYLYNVRTLEVAKKNLIDRKQSILYIISRLGFSQNFYKTSIDGEGMAYAVFGGGGFILLVWVIGTLLNETVGEWFDWTGAITALMIILTVLTIIIAVGWIIYEVYGTYSSNAKTEIKIKQDNERVKKELEEKAMLERSVKSLDEKIGNTDDLLTEAYSVNLIPSKFRNVYAAYFLYDFISTSTASLNEALLHCDLDTIQNKLDAVIQQQEAMIMELAAANAKNDSIVAQNEKMLNYAIQTENNTALAAQYSKVAATNSNVTAFCQMAQFLGT